ncbi:hypothetical protein OSTOST_07306 [Ostertagia ostertagi]
MVDESEEEAVRLNLPSKEASNGLGKFEWDLLRIKITLTKRLGGQGWEAVEQARQKVGRMVMAKPWKYKTPLKIIKGRADEMAAAKRELERVKLLYEQVSARVTAKSFCEYLKEIRWHLNKSEKRARVMHGFF